MKRTILFIVICAATCSIAWTFADQLDTERFSLLRNLLHVQTTRIFRYQTPSNYQAGVSSTDDLLLFRYGMGTTLANDSVKSAWIELFNREDMVLVDKLSKGNVTSYQAIYVVTDSLSSQLIRFTIEGADNPHMDTVKLDSKLRIDSLFAFNDSLTYYDIIMNRYTVLTEVHKDSAKVAIFKSAHFNEWFK